MQRGRHGSALREVQPEFLHRDRGRLLLRSCCDLSVWVCEGLALRLAAEHHRVAGTSWMREAHLASEVGKHDAQCQRISATGSLMNKKVERNKNKNRKQRKKDVPFCGYFGEQLRELLYLACDTRKVELGGEEACHLEEE